MRPLAMLSIGDLFDFGAELDNASRLMALGAMDHE
jgi:hypothetical protein